MPSSQSVSLLERLCAGQPAAVEQWYRAYKPAISRYVYGRIDQRADADEVIQEVFLNCLHSLPQFLGQSALQTWMLAIARHEVNDYYRKRYAKKVLQLLPLGDWLWGDFLDYTDTQHTAAALRADLHETVEHVFSRIGQYYRELLLEKYLDEVSVADLARRRGKSFKTVESELFRARQAFKKAYQELND